MNLRKGTLAHILVVGDVILDKYVWGECERISPEAPVPVINIKQHTYGLGGAANVAHNLKQWGTHVTLLSVLGDDLVSEKIVDLLKHEKITTEALFIEKARVSTQKTRIISRNQQVIRYDEEIIAPPSSDLEQQLIYWIDTHLSEYNVVIASDYGKGVLTTALLQHIIQSARKLNIKVMIDPKGLDYDKYRGAYTITPNRKEAELASGIPIQNEQSLIQAAQYLLEHCKLDVVVITLSEEGIISYDGKLMRYPVMKKKVFDITGAGDTVIAGLAYGLAIGQTLKQAIRFSNLAASVVIRKIGCATATISEILAMDKQYAIQANTNNKILTLSELINVIEKLKVEGKSIVFTNGCFDIFHRGHAEYLHNSKKLGNILVVGLNSDESITRLKGASRPINKQEDRAYILSALNAVDFVTIFEEDTPYELIQAISPDILVKGGDYSKNEVVGANLVEHVEIIPLIENQGSSDIIERIQRHLKVYNVK